MVRPRQDDWFEILDFVDVVVFFYSLNFYFENVVIIINPMVPNEGNSLPRLKESDFISSSGYRDFFHVFNVSWILLTVSWVLYHLLNSITWWRLLVLILKPFLVIILKIFLFEGNFVLCVIFNIIRRNNGVLVNEPDHYYAIVYQRNIHFLKRKNL